MSEAARIAAFGTALRAAFGRFKQEEVFIRSEYDRKKEAGALPPGLGVDDMLERPTRRFLIDPMLRALGWDPDDPSCLTEEARSWGDDGERLYLDYLGRNQRLAPILIVEAKGADAGGVRGPREPKIDAATMRERIKESLLHMKGKGRSPALVAEWVAWLDSLRTYVISLGQVKLTTLSRAVITAGRWLIVFTDPVAAFVDDTVSELGGVYCYTSLDQIVEGAPEIYRLLARRRLTDALPLTLKLGVALEVLEPSTVMAAYRGVVVATRTSGGVQAEYPTRSVYPAMVLISSDRAFAVVDYDSEAVEEPRNADGLPDFLSKLADRGDSFEKRVLKGLGRINLAASALDQYPTTIREPVVSEVFAPASGSTASQMIAATPPRPQLVRRTGARNAEDEYLVVTGQVWFYKMVSPFGSQCDFHAYPKARQRGVAGAEGQFVRGATIFTISDDSQHCEHDDLHGMRSGRCQVDRIESHLCCRACIFHTVCWEAKDLARLPCAT